MEKKISYDLVLKNGVVVDPVNGIHRAMDIGVKNGKIAQVCDEIASSENVVDVSGKTVIPGGIDMHVHCSDSLGGSAGFYMVAGTGITTVVDFAGTANQITTSMQNDKTYGLNVAVLQMLVPTEEEKNDLSRAGIKAQMEQALSAGALGIKILGGHFPLTPQATGRAIEAAVERKVLVAVHSGTTAHGSNLEGMRESIELANGRPFILAHINAYCRGKVRPYQQELEEAFTMLRDNPNVYADSHLATMNACSGLCDGDVLEDQIVVNCLNTFGYPTDRQGLSSAIRDGLVRVLATRPLETVVLERDEALAYWQEQETNAMVSFPVNLSTVATACALERRTPGGEFLIGMTATDGGGIPRNNLLGRILCLYRMGYLSLEDVVMKISATPARVFGFQNKGHLAVGADADITVLDLDTLSPVMSFARGEPLMKDGVRLGKSGVMLVTKDGAPHMASLGLRHEVIDLKDSLLYRHSI